MAQWIANPTYICVNSFHWILVHSSLAPVLNIKLRQGTRRATWLAILCGILPAARPGHATNLRSNYENAQELGKWGQLPLLRDSHIEWLPGMLGGWTDVRDVPAVPSTVRG